MITYRCIRIGNKERQVTKPSSSSTNGSRHDMSSIGINMNILYFYKMKSYPDYSSPHLMYISHREYGYVDYNISFKCVAILICINAKV